jgi:uncharacterized protein YbjT (DUF2867 family)
MHDRSRQGLILVCGASGELGSRVARQLLEAGANIRVLLRDQAEATQEAGAEIVRADFRDRESLAPCATSRPSSAA